MTLILKTLLLLLLLYILVNLALAGIAMIRGGRSMSHYLGRRVGVSALVLLIVLIAAALGYLPLNPRPY
ncbi:DUF2909 family protein [Ferrimonas senticii]|uniref:DUF2909 family protein n=1 Tax=Ferrimonas senticii TaxID=394566 RepID=UPI000407B73D|nr:DUF2909 family protein [Ferrimonas senticii]